MNSNRRFSAANGRALVLATLAASLITAAVPALSQSTAGDAQANSQDPAAMQSRFRERMQTHLDRMATRLQIDGSQQAAWASYRSTVETMIGAPRTRPAADADAATIIRFRANLVSQHAQKLTQLADATAKLEQVLNPAQRQTLAEIVRRQGEFEHHRHPHGPNEHTQAS